MPSIHRVRIFLFAFAYLSILAAETRANSVTIYDDRNAFITASTLTTTVTFEGITPFGTGINYGAPGSVMVSGVAFESAPDVLLEIVNPSNTFGYNTGSSRNHKS